MRRYYTLQLDTVYLTSDGTVSGTPCRVSTDFIDNPISNYRKIIRKDFRGNVKAILTQVNSKGKEIEFSIDQVPFTTAKLIDDLINTNDAAKTTVDLIATHPHESDYDFSFAVYLKNFKYKEFNTSHWLNAVLTVTTSGDVTP